MILADVMDEVSTQLDTISGLRCFAYPPGSVTPPAAIVTYPDTYTYDETYGRGSDRLSLPVVVVLGRPTDRSTRDLMSVYVNGSGAKSVKQVLEAGNYTAFDEVRVVNVEFDVAPIGGTDYLHAIFELDIVGPGSE